MRFVFIYLLIIVVFSMCANDDVSAKQEGQSQLPASKSLNEQKKQLNINILLDLSDRIDVSKHPASPQHFERDIEVIRSIAEIFRDDMKKKGAFKAKGKFRVFFSPAPQDASVNEIAKNLSYDLAAFTGQDATRQKKWVYDSLQRKLQDNLTFIYQLAISHGRDKKQWDGSDIWRFFKNDVNEYCIDHDTSYRNILVILTDGYIYHKDSKQKVGNRTSFILPETIKQFRNDPKWKERFEKADYGLITTRHDLQDMEVLVLEISPSEQYKDDEDIIRLYLQKWFREMGLKDENYRMYNSGLPQYTHSRVQDYFNRYEKQTGITPNN